MSYLRSLRGEKSYEKVIGYGSCYGAFIFAKAQSIKERLDEKLFDKLILDGCWPSIGGMVKKYARDPKLMFNNKTGGWGERRLFKNGSCEKFFLWFTETAFSVDLSRLDLIPYLRDIKHIPVLFIHCTKDKLVTNEEFESIWNSVGSFQKSAVLFSLFHARAHVEEKEIYSYICNSFLTSQCFVLHI